MTEKIYPISYSITPGNFTKEYLKNNDLGGCDAIIIYSIINPPDGSRSEQIIAIGSDGKHLNADEVFKSFIGMAHSLSEDKRLSKGRRLFCLDVVNSIREAMGIEKREEL